SRTLLRNRFDQSDVESVAAQCGREFQWFECRLPNVAERLDAARGGPLAFTALPKQIPLPVDRDHNAARNLRDWRITAVMGQSGPASSVLGPTNQIGKGHGAVAG